MNFEEVYKKAPMFCKSTEQNKQSYKYVDCTDDQIFAAHAGGSVSLKVAREIVNDHIDKLRSLHSLGYRKTNVSNAEKIMYYKREYNAIARMLGNQAALADVERAICCIQAEHYNAPQLDASLLGLNFPNCLILGPRFVMAQLASLRDTDVEARDLLDSLYNKVAVQAAIILYGVVENIDETEARLDREADDAAKAAE